MDSGKKVILFDGVCNLCNSSVNFVIDRDKNNKFVFSALQDEKGKKLVKDHGISELYLDTIVLLKNGKAYTKSTAALEITRDLPGLWPLMYGFIIVPKFIRNWVYDLIAKNRYKWFGKKDECRIPTPELRQKFL